MDISKIAKDNEMSERFVYYIVNGERFTSSPSLAMEIATMTGKKPLDYIRPDRRKMFKKFLPHLNRKVRA
jgi:hypothetical protein